MARRNNCDTSVLRRAISCLVLLCGSAMAIAEEGIYLFSIPAARAVSQTGPLDGRIDATLHVPDAAHAASALAGIRDLEVLKVDGNLVTISFGEGITRNGTPTPDHRMATFVIDFDESALTELVADLQARYGERPSQPELTEFVFRHIANKTYLRSFDLASRVALSREGDCSEHAVLLTALARATGYPARVVLGVLLAQNDANAYAYGHAWTEIHDGRNWQIADATFAQTDASDVRFRYLPLVSLDNEGPGYALDMLRLAAVQPSRISNIQSAAVRISD